MLEHKWIKEDIKEKQPLNVNYDKMKNFTNNNKLKKVALTFIAS